MAGGVEAPTHLNSDRSDCPLCLRSGRMSTEHTCRAELAELVPHHVLSDEDVLEQLAVVNQEGMSDKLRHDRAVACPCLDRLLAVHLGELLDLAVESLLDVWAFFQ